MTPVMQACTYIIAVKEYTKENFLSEFKENLLNEYFLAPDLSYYSRKGITFVIVSYNINFSAS
jgi:hypothetical protein